MTNDRRPDALMLPQDRKQGARMVDRVASIADIAEPLLGIDRTIGERAYIRLQPNSKLFITANVLDTILFPKDHARDGLPRYHWILQPDGSEFGYLVDSTFLNTRT
jgi:hypothetical protein